MDAPPEPPQPPPPPIEDPTLDWNGGIDAVSGLTGSNLEPDAESGYSRRGHVPSAPPVKPGIVEWPWDSRSEFQRQNFTIEIWVNPQADQDRFAGLAGNLHSYGKSHSGWGLLLHMPQPLSFATVPYDRASSGGHDEVVVSWVVADAWYSAAARGLEGGGFSQARADGGVSFEEMVLSSPWALIPANQWSHIAASYDSSVGCKLYVNGVLVDVRGAGEKGINYRLEQYMRVGGVELGGTVLGLRGSVDELRWWGGAKESREIIETLSERLDGGEKLLRGYWMFDQSEGTTVRDSVAIFGCSGKSGEYEGAGECDDGDNRTKHSAYLVTTGAMRWEESLIEWRQRRGGAANEEAVPGGDFLRLGEGMGDNMRLPGNANPCAPIWGYGRSEELVYVDFNRRRYEAVVDSSVARRIGKWRVCLDTTQIAGGPFTIIIKSGGEEKSIGGVMIGHLASNCHNDAQHVVGGGVECHGTAYPRRYIPMGLQYWSFDDCQNPKATMGVGLSRSMTVSGECVKGGLEGNAWRLKGGHKMLIESAGGLKDGGASHSLSLWLLFEEFGGPGSDDVPLVLLGQPTQAPTATQRLGQAGTWAAASGASADPGLPGGGPRGHISLIASWNLCNNTRAAPGGEDAPALVMSVRVNGENVTNYCSGVRLSRGVWYHAAWSLFNGGDEAGDSSSLLLLFVNGFQRRSIPINGTIDMGNKGGRPSFGVDMFVGRIDVVLNATWVLDELWLMGQGLDLAAVRDLMASPSRKHNWLYGPYMHKAAIDFFDDFRNYATSSLAPEGAFQLFGASFESGRGVGSGNMEPANNGTACRKVPPFYADERTSPWGRGRCSADCDCCGSRTCSNHGWCVGDADLDSNPDCQLFDPAQRVRVGEVQDPYFHGSRVKAVSTWQQGMAEDGDGTVRGGELGDYRASRYWRDAVQSEMWNQGADVVRDKIVYQEKLLGIADGAGYGPRSYQPGVTDPNAAG